MSTQKNHFRQTAEKLHGLNVMTDMALSAGSIGKEEHERLKDKIYSAQIGNIFSAMAAYCQK